MDTLRDFVAAELANRKLSIRQFAKNAGLGYQTIANIVNDSGNEPEMKTLLRISKYTGTDLIELVRLAYPDIVQETTLSPSAAITAQRIERLPQDLRLAVEALILRGGK